MIGRVISTKLKNTATVLVERISMHPLYKKTFTRTKKYLVDDILGVKDGDLVEIVSTKPISKRKSFKIVKVLGRSLKEIAEQQMKEKAQEVIAEVMPEKKESEQAKVDSEQSEEKTGKVEKPKRVKKEKKENGTT